MSAQLVMPGRDPAQFLDIATQGAVISSHEDLWRWLQGDVQAWLPHEVMLVGWGDFGTGDLKFDIISSMPGMRSHLWTSATLAPLMNYFRDCWAAAQHQPCQLGMSGCIDLLHLAGHDRAQVETLARMRSALVYGIKGNQRGTDRVFAALSTSGEQRPGAGHALRLLLPFIDLALRRLPPAPVKQPVCNSARFERRAPRVLPLSEREHEIMDWVAMGKTNPEIGCILSISEFTVKNHMKSIFSKLDVTNRAQAVSKLTRMGAHA